jgi:hypothetical protein
MSYQSRLINMASASRRNDQGSEKQRPGPTRW